MIERKRQKISRLNFTFTTRKKKTCLPSLRSNFNRGLKFQVVYETSCSGCESNYVIQIGRHITTRMTERQRFDLPVGQRVVDGCGSSKAFEWRIIDQCSDTDKLLNVEAVHIRQRKPKLNTRDDTGERKWHSIISLIVGWVLRENFKKLY